MSKYIKIALKTTTVAYNVGILQIPDGSLKMSEFRIIYLWGIVIFTLVIWSSENLFWLNFGEGSGNPTSAGDYINVYLFLKQANRQFWGYRNV